MEISLRSLVRYQYDNIYMFNTRNKSGISAHPCIILYIFQPFCFFVNSSSSYSCMADKYTNSHLLALCCESFQHHATWPCKVEQDVHEQVHNCANKNEEKANNGVDAVHIDAVKRIHTEVNLRWRSDISVASRQSLKIIFYF
jgi:hypothetical protein